MCARYKAIWERGYVPVLERKASEPYFKNSLEAWAARTLPIETDPGGIIHSLPSHILAASLGG